jgi:hypothetical protein
MAVSAKWYAAPLKGFFNGSPPFDFDSDTMKLALCTASYTPNQKTHAFFSDITNELGTENGYTAGGLVLTSCEVEQKELETRLKAATAVWTITTSSVTARYAIVYKSTGTSSTSPLAGYVDFGASMTVPAGGKFTVEWATSGVLFAKIE